MFEISLKTLELMRLNALMHLSILRPYENTQDVQKNKLIADIRELLHSLEYQIQKIQNHEKAEY